MTQQELADRAECDVATVFRYEQDASRLFNQKANDIAKVLGLRSADHLVSGMPDQVRVEGKVGAGAVVLPLDSGSDWIEGPPGLVDGIAFRVDGRSMLPVYRPDDILFVEQRVRIAPDIVGQDCIVQVKDGPRLVKRVHRGSTTGKYRLYSYDTQDETDDVELLSASPVRWVSR